MLTEILTRGYTVFAVVHGSQPQYTIPEIIQDLNRAVRFIRHHAGTTRSTPAASASTAARPEATSSLMQGTAGETGNPKAKDPVDAVRAGSRPWPASSRPPTSSITASRGKSPSAAASWLVFKAAFDFREFDTRTKAFVPVKDEEQILKIGRTISPIYHVSKDDPPTLIFHGDADKLVPIQQSKLLLQKLKEKGVEAKLVVKPGIGHAYGLVMGYGYGWPNLSEDLALIADWFDTHLKR